MRMRYDLVDRNKQFGWEQVVAFLRASPQKPLPWGPEEILTQQHPQPCSI